MTRDTPTNLPAQAAVRKHSQWVRCEQYYQHVWTFDIGDSPPGDDDLQSYIDACDGMQAQREAMKVYIRDGELAIMVRPFQVGTKSQTER